MKIKAKGIAIAVIGTFAIGIALANVLGVWKTTGSKIPVAIKEGEFAGLPNPADIRGSYTWNDVANAFKFDVALALEAFGATDATTKVNSLEAIYKGAGLPEGSEIGTDSVRLFASLLVGLPFTPEEGTVLPSSAVAVLRANGKAEAARIEEVAARAYAGPTSAAAPASAVVASKAATSPALTAVKPAAAPTPAASAQPAVSAPAAETAAGAPAVAPASGGEASVDHVAPTGTVTGKTTFKDMLDQGVSEEKIKAVTGGKIGPASATIKDWAAANGLTFSELKVGLQALLSK